MWEDDRREVGVRRGAGWWSGGCMIGKTDGRVMRVEVKDIWARVLPRGS